MKEIFNIFPRRKYEKPTGKKSVENPKIIADYREKNSMVPSELIKLGIDIEFKNLKVGDYIAGNVVVERKTIPDFISSMINRRLLTQLEELQQYENRLLIIEGIEEQDLYNDYKADSGVNSNAIRGFLLSISLKHKIPVIFSKNAEDTAKFFLILLKKKESEVSLNAKKRVFNKKEQLQFIIEGFPGIGPKTAKKLLKEFKTIKKIINATEDKLKRILGKKAEIFIRLINENY